MANNIPKHWGSVRFKEIIGYVIGGDWGLDYTEKHSDEYSPVYIIRGTELKKWKYGKGQTAVKRLVAVDSILKRMLMPGDIIIEISGGGPDQPVGRTVVIDKNIINSFDAPIICTNFFRLIRTPKSVNSKFLNHQLDYNYQNGVFDQYQTNTTNLRNLTFGKLTEELPIFLPPKEEQYRISLSLDILFKNLNSIQYQLDDFPKFIAEFRQQVLHYAFRGKLTNDWRRENKKYSSSDLLYKKLISSDQYNKVRSRDFTFSLPRGWKKCEFNVAAEIKSNLVDPKKYLKYPHIAPDNIQKESGKLLSYKTIAEDKIHSPNHYFYKGQIIYSKIRPYLSKVIIASFEGLCSADMYPIKSKINTKYLYYYMLSDIFKEFASTAGTRSVLPKINQKELSIIPVPLPSLFEQKEIVKRVNMLMNQIDYVENQYRLIKNIAKDLPQQILTKAFNGELVPRNLEDEPVERLLERISEEKAKMIEDRSGSKRKQVIN